MKKHLFSVFIFSLFSFQGTIASAGPVRVFVQEFAVSGQQGKDDLKAVFQNMLASRLSGGSIETVESTAAADVLVKGSYVVFGKVFSLDAVAREHGGKVVARAFQQGESQDELVAAMGRLAQSLSEAIGTAKVEPRVKTGTVGQVSPVTQGAETADIIKASSFDKSGGVAWNSQRLDGDYIGIAPGTIGKDGSRELFLADDQSVRLYRQDEQLKLLAEVKLPGNANVLGIDTADLDNDGAVEAYVTVLANDSLVSQIWVAKEGKLVKIADKLPYFFRGLALEGRQKKIYVQELGNQTDFYGDVFELVKKGGGYEKQNALKLPRFGNLFNFNRFIGKDGTSHFVVLSPDGYIIVYSASGEELWRSSDKFGGSQLFFKREDLTNLRLTGDTHRWIFLEQRIYVTEDGQIVVPQNKGTFVFGNNRSFNKKSVYSFKWNGGSLDELWHTRETPNYLADYYYDESRKALVQLEVVKKEGPVAKGASQVTVKKVE